MSTSPPPLPSEATTHPTQTMPDPLDNTESVVAPLPKVWDVDAETGTMSCIVCLLDLPSTTADLPADGSTSRVAKLIPCNHVIHDTCLTPWLSRANTCPICRATFNRVHLSETLTGTVTEELEVEDRRQQAPEEHRLPIFLTLDLMFGDDEPESNECQLCNAPLNDDAIVNCDTCNGPFHIYCTGLDAAPSGAWQCTKCISIEEDAAFGTANIANVRFRRNVARSPTEALSTRRNSAAIAEDAWSHLNRDMDEGINGEEEAVEEYGRCNDCADAEEEEELQSKRSIILDESDDEEERDIKASSGLTLSRGAKYDYCEPEELPVRRPREPMLWETPPTVEAAESWKVFEHVKELDLLPGSRKRTSGDVTDDDHVSDTPTEPVASAPRKRPRTKPNSTFAQPPSSRPNLNTSLPGPSVFSSWVNKLGSPPTPGYENPLTPFGPSSPCSRANQRPGSSLPPTSPVAEPPQSPLSPVSASSPSRYGTTLSIKCKEEVASVVSSVLRPFYRSKRINTAQYTEINKKISRDLYQVVAMPENNFSDSFYSVDDEKCRIKQMAEEKVLTAIENLK